MADNQLLHLVIGGELSSLSMCRQSIVATIHPDATRAIASKSPNNLSSVVAAKSTSRIDFAPTVLVLVFLWVFSSHGGSVITTRQLPAGNCASTSRQSPQ